MMPFDEYFDLWEAGDASDIMLKGRRFPLVTIVGKFKEGWQPDAIAAAYRDLSLREVYASVLYYLEHTEEVDRRIDEIDAAHRRGVAAQEAAGHAGFARLRQRMAEKLASPKAETVA